MLQRSSRLARLATRLLEKPNPLASLFSLSHRMRVSHSHGSHPLLCAISTAPDTQKTLLDYLRTRSQVDCDTLDATVASSLGPFVDCTSNQAIAFFELSKPEHIDTLKVAVATAKKLHHQFPEVTKVTLATEIAVSIPATAGAVLKAVLSSCCLNV